MATTQGPLGANATSNNGQRNGQRDGRVLPTTPLAERSLGELVATLSRDIALLVHQEIELVKTDLKATAIKIAAGAAGFVIALIALVFALPMLLTAAAFGIHALGISLGFSFLIVFGGLTVLGLIAAGAAMIPLRKTKSPKRVVDSMKADLQAIARVPKPKPSEPAMTPNGKPTSALTSAPTGTTPAGVR